MLECNNQISNLKNYCIYLSELLSFVEIWCDSIRMFYILLNLTEQVGQF